MYGANSAQIRAELATLLHQSRTHTNADWEWPVELIGRFRHTVLLWCLQATRTVTPDIELYGTSGRTRGPAEELRHRLTKAIAASAGLPSLEELVTEQEISMVETWRQAARAAALGEHDFDTGLTYSTLSDQQAMTVLKDAAEITRGLVALDKRHTSVPGWKSLKDQDHLGRAAGVCAAFAGYGDPDYTVDRRGWRPAPGTVDGPAMPGLAGVLQGEHNLLVHLTTFPNAHSLRLVLDSQRVLSHKASVRIRDVAPQLADRWQTRAGTYTTLIRATRDLGGQIGGGGLAAAEGANAISRLQRLRDPAAEQRRALRQLDRLFTRIDARISDIIEHGAATKLYFLRVRLPRVVDQPAGLVKPVRERYIPISSSPSATDLIEIVRTRLRLPPATPRPSSGADRGRTRFESAIIHPPTGLDEGPAISF